MYSQKQEMDCIRSVLFLKFIMLYHMEYRTIQGSHGVNRTKGFYDIIHWIPFAGKGAKL